MIREEKSNNKELNIKSYEISSGQLHLDLLLGHPRRLPKINTPAASFTTPPNSRQSPESVSTKSFPAIGTLIGAVVATDINLSPSSPTSPLDESAHTKLNFRMSMSR
jgi:hypothetical protein